MNSTITMTNEQVFQELSLKYKLLFQTEYSIVHHIPEQNTIVCELTESYVPIEEFREIFLKISEYVKQFPTYHFIFDKRNLRTFHQPSMEWYFISWKTEMLQFGLKTHRKILPQNEPWFAEAVNAGRMEIAEKYPDHDFSKLDIQYRDSMEDALKEFAKN